MEFERRLTNAWSIRTDHVAKRRIVKIAVHGRWPEELRLIESVESLKAEL